MTIHHIRRATGLMLGFVTVIAIVLFANAKTSSTSKKNAMTTTAASIHEFTVNDIEGKSVKLDAYKGKVVLIVNVASKCGFTPQYTGLEALYKQYKDKGLVILGFPANNFLGQEPGSDAEIKQFCSTKYNVSFPMFSKISVKGSDIHPLYQFLTEKSNPPGDVRWNFGKFLVGKDGKIISRFDSKVAPESQELVSAIESALK